MDQNTFHDLISGKTRGWFPNLLRGLLQPVSWAYGLVVSCRSTLYGHGLLRSYRAPCPVICIGNLTTGGTGKTPLVAWLCQVLSQEMKVQCAVLTRGYKSSCTKTDEPAMLEKQLGIPVLVNGDRIASTKLALSRGPVDVFVMDDGFQHQRLARDLNILTLDATNPFGYKKLLPAGLLREPMTAIRRAQCVVITRSDQVTDNNLKTLTTTIQNVSPGMRIATAVHRPTAVHIPGKDTQPPSWLQDRAVFAFCGIGNPCAFFETLEKLGVHCVGTQRFDDHYHCTKKDLQDLQAQATMKGAELLLTTEKNFPDIAAIDTPLSVPVGYLSVALAFESGEDHVKELIEQTLACKISQS
ncbi:MAG: tetraacyldisaccharide 4'-kinase [Phycisphaerae bacterium]|nr:tetraacyldisaccharide 4'-kinase [Phycisphaerae bacterium]